MTGRAPLILPIDHLELRYAPARWRFQEENQSRIDAHFARRRESAPQMWNGRVLLLRDYEIAGRTLRGTYFETDFAAFLAWRDWEFPDRTVSNCFAMGALRTTDAAYLLGVMSQGTANPGRIYFPAGTPDPDDVRGDIVDLAGSVIREVGEETGLTPRDFAAASGWTMIVADSRVALMKRLDLPESAVHARERILRYLTEDPHAELQDIRIVRGESDIDPMMPDFVVSYLRHVFSGGAE